MEQAEDDLLLDLALQLAEINGIEVKITDDRVFAIVSSKGTRKASTESVNYRETNIGGATHKAVCKAIDYIRVEFGLAKNKPPEGG